MIGSGTREQILDTMQNLIQTKGFNGISFQDISEVLGITKASIHYHFPSKFGLGQSAIERYRQTFSEVMTNARAPGRSYWQILQEYFGPFARLSETESQVCLCGALAGEFVSLPTEMRSEVVRYFREHEDWLETVLEEGRSAGEFRFAGTSQSMARLVFSALQGSLLIGRAKDDDELKQAIETFRSLLVV